MYEVEFNIDASRMSDLFGKARIDFQGDIGSINGQVWNAVGSAPIKPLGFSPTYDQGARGPTPRVTPFSVERLTVAFPAFIVIGEGDGTRHYLNKNATDFFEACVQLAARRPDLMPQATLGVTVRRMFEENEPSEDNATDASQLYSAVDEYERNVIVYAGGDESNYTVTFDVMKRPKATSVENYGATQ